MVKKKEKKHKIFPYTYPPYTVKEQVQYNCTKNS